MNPILTVMLGRVMEENVEMVCASAKRGDAKAKVFITVLDHGRPSLETKVKLLIDSGVNKTLISDKDWAKVKQRPGDNPMKLKRVKTSLTPFDTKVKLPILGRTKCVMRAEAGAEITTIIMWWLERRGTARVVGCRGVGHH